MAEWRSQREKVQLAEITDVHAERTSEINRIKEHVIFWRNFRKAAVEEQKKLRATKSEINPAVLKVVDAEIEETKELIISLISSESQLQTQEKNRQKTSNQALEVSRFKRVRHNVNNALTRLQSSTRLLSVFLPALQKREQWPKKGTQTPGDIVAETIIQTNVKPLSTDALNVVTAQQDVRVAPVGLGDFSRADQFTIQKGDQLLDRRIEGGSIFFNTDKRIRQGHVIADQLQQAMNDQSVDARRVRQLTSQFALLKDQDCSLEAFLQKI